MKKLMTFNLAVAISIALLTSCGKGGQQHKEVQEAVNEDPNQALYDQVMDVHNEVMPKTSEIYQLKKELKDKMDVEPEKKAELEKIVAELDSADHAMMDWMHKFNEPDSASQEVAREYLENEMEKINRVKELINASIRKAKDELGKK